MSWIRDILLHKSLANNHISQASVCWQVPPGAAQLALQVTQGRDQEIRQLQVEPRRQLRWVLGNYGIEQGSTFASLVTCPVTSIYCNVKY